MGKVSDTLKQLSSEAAKLAKTVEKQEDSDIAKQILIRVSPELHGRIKQLTNETQKPQNTLVINLIEAGLKQLYPDGDIQADSPKYLTQDDLITFEAELLKKVQSLIGSSQAIATDKTLSPEQKERVFNEVKNISNVANHGKQITYTLALDGSVVSRSVRGTDIRTLKKLDDNQLKEIGLRREAIGDQVKFYPIEY